MRGLLLQYEGYLHVDLVAFDVAVLDQDVLVLNPCAFDAPERLGSTGYGLLDGIIEARLRRGAQLGYSGNAHTYLCASFASSLLPVLLMAQQSKYQTRRPESKDL